jgi:hypothetical protein
MVTLSSPTDAIRPDKLNISISAETVYLLDYPPHLADRDLGDQPTADRDNDRHGFAVAIHSDG